MQVSGLQAVLTGLRAELERGEVERQSLEYQLALSHRQTDREAERSATLTTHNHTLRGESHTHTQTRTRTGAVRHTR